MDQTQHFAYDCSLEDIIDDAYGLNINQNRSVLIPEKSNENQQPLLLTLNKPSIKKQAKIDFNLSISQPLFRQTSGVLSS